MNCPVCLDVTLAIASREGIEIDHCPRCRGVWLDRGELDKIIERSGAYAASSTADERPRPRDDDRDRDREARRGRDEPRDYPRDYPRGDDRPRERRDDDDDDWQYSKKKKRRSFFEDIFDF